MPQGKVAFITGTSGQTAQHLVDHLVGTGEYSAIYCLYRRVVRGEEQILVPELGLDESVFSPYLTTLFPYLAEGLRSGLVRLVKGNLTDFPRMSTLLQELQPHEIYNLAAQSHVQDSFFCHEETMATNAKAVFHMLRVIKLHLPECRFYQASSSEMFGNQPAPQNELTLMTPVSPYGESKLKAHRYVQQARDQNGIYACGGILFNHESENRGRKFVTRKITYGIACIQAGRQDIIELGNLEARRDWGYARDYARAQHLMLQQPVQDGREVQDYVIATGQTRSICEFVNAAYRVLDKQVEWAGEGKSKKGRVDGIVRIRVNPEFFRDNELHTLCGDASKAQRELGWTPTVTFDQMVERMVRHDMYILGL